MDIRKNRWFTIDLGRERYDIISQHVLQSDNLVSAICENILRSNQSYYLNNDIAIISLFFFVFFYQHQFQIRSYARHYKP